MAEQILIEFVGDSSKLVPSIELLEKLGQIDASAADAFQQTNAELAKRAEVVKKVSAEEQKHIKTVEDVVTAYDTLATAVTDGFQDSVVDAFVSAGVSADDFKKKVKDSGLSFEDVKKKIADFSKQGVDGTKKITLMIRDLEKQQQSLRAATQRAMDPALLKQYEEGISTTDAQLKELYQALDQLQAAGHVWDEFADGTEETEEKSKSLKQELKELKQQLAQLELQGKRNSAEYQELVARAGELNDAIGDAGDAIANAGSDTQHMDNLISLAGAVTGGFAAAQGAAALFGSENEEVQKTLLKVNAAMAILQGLQQVQDVMSKRQFASLGALLGLKQADAAATVAQGEATVATTGATQGATVATRIWNAVLKANPIILLISAIIAAVAAIKIFASNTKDAEAAQDALNDALAEGNELLDATVKGYQSANQKIVADLKKSGATQEQLMKNDINNLALTKKARMEAYDITVKTLNDENVKRELSSEDYKKLLDQERTLAYQIKQDEADLYSKGVEEQILLNEKALKSYQAYAEARVVQARAGSNAELEAQIDAIKARVDVEKKLNHDLTPGERAKLEAEAARQIAEIRNKQLVNVLEDQKAITEARLANVQEGSVQELELRKKLAAQQAEIDANAFGLSDEKMKAIRAKGQQEQLEFDRQIAQKRIEIQINGINAALAATKEGSVEEFKLQVDLLQKQRDFDLQQKGLTDDKRLLIEAEYLRKVRDLTKQHNFEVAQDALTMKLFDTNTNLAQLQRANISETNAELLQLKKDAIDEQAALDELNAQNTIHNEELLQVKLKEIRAKAVADKTAIIEQARSAVINNNEELYQLEASHEAKVLQIQLAGNDLSLSQRIAARQRIKEIEKEQIDSEMTSLRRKYTNGLMTEEEYQKQKGAIQAKYDDLELRRAQEKEDRKKQLVQAGFDFMKQVADAMFETDAQNRQAQLDKDLKNLEAQKQKEVDAKNLTEQQKADIDARYKEKERQIRRNAWEAEKKAKKEQAEINGALAITNILATMPKFDFGIASAIAIAAAVASTAIQVAKINAAQVPAFAKGTRYAPRGYAWVGEEGPELVQLSGGERIWTYSQSKKIAEAWNGGIPHTPEQILSGNLPTPVDPDMISNTYVNQSGELQIDYDRLGRSVAKYVPAPVQNHINMDESGFSKHIIEQGSKTKILNQRYKFD